MRRPTTLLAARSAAAALLAFALLAHGASAADLLAGKRLTLKDKANPKQDGVSFTYRKDPGLFALADPTCGSGNATSIQIVTSGGVGPEVVLPCAGWKLASGGFRYSAKAGGAGGVRSIKFAAGALSLRASGPPYSALGGPVSFVETRFRVGSNLYCGRFEEPTSRFRRNLADLVTVTGPTVPCQLSCGDGILDAGEACDDGNATSGDGCDANCTVTACGNGIVAGAETCDDGNTSSGDGCRANCTQELCGDGTVDAGEACDDGNVAGGDCCSASCGLEAGACDDRNGCTTGDVCSNGACVGTTLAPWVNEFDYDDYFGFPNDDRDEFVEIAGPAGTDLSGYRILAVEGAGPQCSTGFFVNAGDAHFTATIPNGTVLADDTGTGIGFFVACFSYTSSNVVASGKCDAVLPAPFFDSNLKNGNLTNADEFSCPDGILVLDPDDNLVDAISYEGTVANAGLYGAYFHVVPYRAPRDVGWLKGVPIERTTSTLAPATSAAEWRDPSQSSLCVDQFSLLGLCPTNLATPGSENPLQNLECGSPCRAFLDPSDDLFR